MYMAAMGVFFGLFLPVTALAHGTGFSLQERDGPYSIDVHYPYAFQAGVPIWLNFFLSRAEEDDSVSFSEVAVSIRDGEETVFQVDIPRKIGEATGAIVTLPRAGDYTIEVAFRNASTTIATATLPFSADAGSVEGGRGTVGNIFNFENLSTALLLGLVVAGFIFTYRITRRRDSENHP